MNADPCYSGSTTLMRIRITDADPYPAFHSDADPDPTFHFDADPDPDSQHCQRHKPLDVKTLISKGCRT
jgi:hypothetical protein